MRWPVAAMACLCYGCSVWGETRDPVLTRVNAYLTLNDVSSACQLADAALALHPDDRALHEAHLMALAHSEDNDGMMRAWQNYARLFPDAYERSDLLETMAWGIVRQGSASSSPLMRLVAVAAAAQSNDSYGVALVAQSLSDTNAAVRQAAALLSPRLGDAILCERLTAMLTRERIPAVRLAALHALGEMRAVQGCDAMMDILLNDQALAEERAVAAEALVKKVEWGGKEDLLVLAKSPRAGLRLLACEIVAFLSLEAAADLVADLVHDPNAEVRQAALAVLGLLKVPFTRQRPVASLALSMLSDPDPHVAITAAWLATLWDLPEGVHSFEGWLGHEAPALRLAAAGALAATGRHGCALMQRRFYETQDVYVRLNLALGLLGQRLVLNDAGELLCVALSQEKERWAHNRFGLFTSIVPARVRNRAPETADADTENQLTRLEVLGALATIDSQRAERAIRDFFQTERWGITGTAALLLLQEGGESAIDVVRGLLTDDNASIRIQAALALALWGRDPVAGETLEKAYPEVDRSLKEKILQAFTVMGGAENIRFLVDRLQEPSAILRLLAASGIIVAVNK